MKVHPETMQKPYKKLIKSSNFIEIPSFSWCTQSNEAVCMCMQGCDNGLYDDGSNVLQLQKQQSCTHRFLPLRLSPQWVHSPWAMGPWDQGPMCPVGPLLLLRQSTPPPPHPPPCP